MSTLCCGLSQRWSGDEEGRQDRGAAAQPQWWSVSPTEGPARRAAGSCFHRPQLTWHGSRGCFVASASSSQSRSPLGCLHVGLYFLPQATPATVGTAALHGVLSVYTFIALQICFHFSLLEPGGSAGPTGVACFCGGLLLLPHAALPHLSVLNVSW